MKKIISILFASMMVLALAACSTPAQQESDSTKENQTIAETVNQESSSSTEEQTTEATEQESNSTEAEQTPETVTVITRNGASENVEISVPYNPERIAVMDMATLDILDNLGLGDRVVGSSTTTLDYLQSYVTDDSIVNLGTIKEADMEAVMECEPDIIFIGGRLSTSYDALSEIAPVVLLSTDSSIGVLESTKQNAKTIASIFGKEAEVDEKFAGFDERIAALQEIADGKTAVVGMCTSGSFNVVGNGGRCSIIGVEIGFENLCDETSSEENSERGGNSGRDGNSENGENSGRDGNSENGENSGRGGNSENGENSGRGGNGNNSAHGSEASFELIVSLSPDYIFVMDRDAAIGTNGAQLAKDIMENELVMSTDAYKNGNLIILEHPAVWYTAEGGVTAFDIMLSDLESALME